jgi:predicted chitinase
MLKSLLLSLAIILSPISGSVTLQNHTLESESLVTTSCKTKINNYQGSCIRPVECDGGIYNNLCPGSFKCCVEDVKSSPWFYWSYVGKDEFKQLFPLLGNARTDVLYTWFNDALGNVLEDKKGNDKCNIIPAFAAQLAHESVGLSTFEEFASGEAYEGRCKQLGNCISGDGVKYKGRGAIQITGRSNYKQVSSYLGEDFINNPELLVFPSYGFKASVWFWVKNNLNQYCTGKLNDFIELTKKINGGINGLEDRINKWNNARNVVVC